MHPALRGLLPVGPGQLANAAWGWRDRSLLEYFAWSAAHGLRGVEVNGHPLAPGHLLDAEDPSVLPRVAGLAEAAGVEIVCVAGRNDFTSPDAGEHDRQLRRARFFIDAAQALGAPFVRLLSGGHRLDPLPPGVFGQLQAAFTAVGRYAEARGVRVVIENHGGPTMTGPRVARILEGVESGAVGLNYDPANYLFQGTDPLMALRWTLPWVMYTHWKDVTWADGGPRLCAFGEGEVQWLPILRLLLESGYTGWWGIEYEDSADVGEGTRRSRDALLALVGDL